MANNQSALGKGLDLLIRETRSGRDAGGVQTLPLKDILPNPNQPRRTFDEKALEELAASIRSQGLLQPILVRPLGEGLPGKYEIVAGERRWRASGLAGLREVPVLVRDFSVQDTLTAALVENLQREDLNPLEEAQGLQTLKEEFGLSQEDLAQRLGKSRSAVANSLRLLILPESIRKDVADGRLSAGHARALLAVADTRSQEYLCDVILEKDLTVREAEGMAATWKATGSFHPEGSERIADSGKGGPAEAESPAFVPAPPRKAEIVSKGKGSPQSARMFALQARIGAVLDLPVRVTGGGSKGKISFSYSSREELQRLLERFGLAVEEPSGIQAAATEGGFVHE